MENMRGDSETLETIKTIKTIETIEVRLGRRLVVLGDVLLGPRVTRPSAAVAQELTAALDRWHGPGLVVVSGNFFMPEGAQARMDAGCVRATLAAHPDLAAALRRFTSTPGRRFVVLSAWGAKGDQPTGGLGVALAEVGIEVREGVDLVMCTAAGARRVVVRPPTADAIAGHAQVPPTPSAARSWLVGSDRLEDPSALTRFVTSRTIYRRLARYGWLMLLPALAALLLRIQDVVGGLERLFGRASVPRRALSSAYAAPWPDWVVAVGLATAGVLVLLAMAQWALSRSVWRALGGGAIGPLRAAPRAQPGAPPASGVGLVERQEALDEARLLIASGVAGVVVGGSLGAGFVHLGTGFFASPGACGELVREHPGRFGLPPVFVHHCQVGWLELEAGSDLHARLLLADAVLPASSPYERLCAADVAIVRREPAGGVRPELVASWLLGSSWPVPSAEAADRTTTRRVRRLTAAAIFTAGVMDLLEAVRPPRAGHLRLVEQLLSIGDVQAARALMAFGAIALVMVARGLLRGQRRAWVVAVAAVSATLVLRLVGDALLVGVVISTVVLALLLTQRRHFTAVADHRSWRSASVTLSAGVSIAIGGAFSAVELSHLHRHQLPGWPLVLAGLVERLAGIQAIALPGRVNTWTSPSLLAVGCALVLVAAFFGTRPVVDRRLSAVHGSPARHVAERRARDIVRRHGTGSLDYFALRDDKQWFFHRDTLVAYAVYGGVCLVSPDPIGPATERAQAWTAFRRFADHQGWPVGVVGAGEEWLPTFRAASMRYAYIGDEAVVAVQEFSLSGNQMKGLRQACTRAERSGYCVSFLDPAHVDPATAAALRDLMGRNRRGECERGFSMTLGRLFDGRDAGLLLTVVHGPDGEPAAVCQFVPARSIGGFSLDVMRRDPGDHPNGILDFALCATIEHLKAQGCQGLSLNFATLRATLDGDAGDGVVQRVERWALRRMSGVLQIESLWRFNAKYRPKWLPRYVVFDSAEHFVPTVLNMLRAESLSEIPVLGRLLATGAPRPVVARPDGGGRGTADGDGADERVTASLGS